MKERVGWIDGMKGYACLVVLFGHSVACIFPNMIFGDSYAAHSVVEQFIHKSPFSLIYSSGQMNGIFFALSGWLIATRTVHSSFINRLISKYLKFVPVTLVSIIITYLVMHESLIYAHPLAEFSYAANYVGGANAFDPSIVGENGFLRDALVSIFTSQSMYVGPLWFLTILFWGSLLVEGVEKCFSNRKARYAIYIFLYFIVMNLESVDWRIPYVGFMLVGAIASQVKCKKKIGNVLNYILFAIGIYISATGDYVGIYKPLGLLWSSLGLNLKVIGALFVIVSVSNSDKLKCIFDTKIGKWLSKYSLAIYVIHWSMVISVSCGVTYILHVMRGANYMISGTVGIITGLLVTLLLAVLFTEDVYNPYCKVVVKGFQKIIKKISEDSDERKSEVCNTVSKVP